MNRKEYYMILIENFIEQGIYCEHNYSDISCSEIKGIIEEIYNELQIKENKEKVFEKIENICKKTQKCKCGNSNIDIYIEDIKKIISNLF